MEGKITTQNDLYKRLKPALRTKKHELILNGIKFVKEIDIWNYNKEHNWCNAKGLNIAGMVDDILNTHDKDYEKYVLDKINKENRE
jgi:hypothetical protein